MNIYENVVIINPALNEDDLKTALDKISEQITKAGGEVLKIEQWGKRKLAYEMNKQRMGFYVMFLFKSPASFIKDLEYYYKVFDPIIKYMIIKLEKKQIDSLPKELLGIPVTSQELSSTTEPEV